MSKTETKQRSAKKDKYRGFSRKEDNIKHANNIQTVNDNWLIQQNDRVIKNFYRSKRPFKPRRPVDATPNF